jgi:SAM-dependent methyltransferase
VVPHTVTWTWWRSAARRNRLKHAKSYVRALPHGTQSDRWLAAQSFDRTAADYDRRGDLSENARFTNWLVSVLPPAGGRALDLGCGTGRHAVLLAERFAHVDATDLSLPMIEIARAKRSRPNITYQQADLLKTSGSGDRFFSREEMERCCATLFPGCTMERLGGTVVGLTWDSSR